jgi:hypothetical protein
MAYRYGCFPLSPANCTVQQFSVQVFASDTGWQDYITDFGAGIILESGIFIDWLNATDDALRRSALADRFRLSGAKEWIWAEYGERVATILEWVISYSSPVPFRPPDPSVVPLPSSPMPNFPPPPLPRPPQ